ncbi:hypothetical protein ACA910_007155 [Epithemia clementina (nom. ined.)]
MKLLFHRRSLLLAAATLGYLSTTTKVTATTTAGTPDAAAGFDLVDGTQYLRRHALEVQVLNEDNYDDATHHDDFRVLVATCPADAYDLPPFLGGCSTVQTKCTSSDLSVVRAYVDAGTCAQSTCTACGTVTGDLRIVIDNGTGSIRTAFGIFGTLEITNANCAAQAGSCPLNRCADTEATRGGVNAITLPGLNDVKVGKITFPCGSQLRIVNYYLKWTDAADNSICKDITCKNFKPKCGKPVSIITIEPPIQVTATATCTTSGKVNLAATVQNAAAGTTISYQWKDKNNNNVVGGTTANVANQPADLQPYSVAVTYPDKANPSITCSPSPVTAVAQSCCSFSATCKTLNPISVNGCNAGAAPLAKTDPKDIAEVTSCGTPTMTVADSLSGSVCDTAGLIITRTYTIKDSSTNDSKTCPPQTITIRDTSAPTFTLSPANKNVECGTTCASTLAPACTDGLATASDNCDTPKVEFSDATTAGCGNTKTVTRTWTATDTCGNSATPFVQTITVVDTTDPILTIPSDKTIECGAVGACTDATAACAGVATATDSCGAVEVSTSDSTSVGVCSTIITRAWTAKDECGRTVTKNQKITTTDTTPPVIEGGCPANIADATCRSTIPANVTVTATDVCSTSAADITETFTCCLTGNTINRNWTFKDKCGNTASCSQDITITCQS